MHTELFETADKILFDNKDSSIEVKGKILTCETSLKIPQMEGTDSLHFRLVERNELIYLQDELSKNWWVDVACLGLLKQFELID